MSKTRTVVLSVFAALLALATVLPSSLDAGAFHTRLVKSEPMKDSTVTVAPTALKLYFSEPVKPAIAGVRLLSSDSSVVTLGTLSSGEGTPGPIVAPITGAIKSGTYRVMWRVAGNDGHPVTGTYVFTVKTP